MIIVIKFFWSVEELLELHRGQGMDIYWRDSFTCPTEEEYKEMVRKSKLCIYLTRHVVSKYDIKNGKEYKNRKRKWLH